jgi:hypothetical protein
MLIIELNFHLQKQRLVNHKNTTRGFKIAIYDQTILDFFQTSLTTRYKNNSDFSYL